MSPESSTKIRDKRSSQVQDATRSSVTLSLPQSGEGEVAKTLVLGRSTSSSVASSKRSFEMPSAETSTRQLQEGMLSFAAPSSQQSSQIDFMKVRMPRSEVPNLKTSPPSDILPLAPAPKKARMEGIAQVSRKAAEGSQSSNMAVWWQRFAQATKQSHAAANICAQCISSPAVHCSATSSNSEPEAEPTVDEDEAQWGRSRMFWTS